jgi:hypothetical protein
MMEVMRVDDNAHFDKLTGKLINPIRAREHELIKSRTDEGVFKEFPQDCNLFITANTQLPTEDDHNYLFYRDNFIRVIKKHQERIVSYTQNHPGYKLIFFVFDESTAYIKLANGRAKSSINMNGQIHFWWLDEVFINSIEDLEIDFLIWMAPYKKANIKGGINVDLPETCIYDVRNMKLQTIAYPERRMVSAEK